MTEIMPVPRNLILLSYQQGAYSVSFLCDGGSGGYPSGAVEKVRVRIYPLSVEAKENAHPPPV